MKGLVITIIAVAFLTIVVGLRRQEELLNQIAEYQHRELMLEAQQAFYQKQIRDTIDIPFSKHESY